MDTENVEIIKAMVKTGLGISIVPYQAIAREVRTEQFFCARIEGRTLVRETGWVYARANRVPRMINELVIGVRRDPGPLQLAPPERAAFDGRRHLDRSSGGIANSNTVCPGSLRDARSVPPCRSTIALTIDRPRPLPCDTGRARAGSTRDSSAL